MPIRHAGRLPAIIIAVALVVSGCATQQDNTFGPKTGIGAAMGGAGGCLLAAAAGGGTKGIIGGVLIGGLLGGVLGNTLDQKDRKLADEAAVRALEYQPTGTPTGWQNPDNGNTGNFTPTRTYQQADGTYCREYQQVLIVGGETQKAFGTACRQPDGQWKIIS